MQFHCWLECKDRLRTKDKLQRLGIVGDDRCMLCGAGTENRDHFFSFSFKCEFSKHV